MGSFSYRLKLGKCIRKDELDQPLLLSPLHPPLGLRLEYWADSNRKGPRQTRKTWRGRFSNRRERWFPGAPNDGQLSAIFWILKIRRYNLARQFKLVNHTLVDYGSRYDDTSRCILASRKKNAYALFWTHFSSLSSLLFHSFFLSFMS